MPFKSVDSAFSIASSIFFFKGKHFFKHNLKANFKIKQFHLIKIMSSGKAIGTRTSLVKYHSKQMLQLAGETQDWTAA